MFVDRAEAGRLLAAHLARRGVAADIVLGVPHGGAVVAAEVARVLRLPLEIIVVRKLGFARHPDVSMGAIGEGGARYIDADLVQGTGVTLTELRTIERRERAGLDQQASVLREGRLRPELTDLRVLIVDDGIVTGLTASAASLVARGLGAAGILVAAPVVGPDVSRRVHGADRVVGLQQYEDIQALGDHYLSFEQVTDAEVARLLERDDRS